MAASETVPVAVSDDDPKRTRTGDALGGAATGSEASTAVSALSTSETNGRTSDLLALVHQFEPSLPTHAFRYGALVEPPWTLWDVSADEWTAFGTMLIALVARGVGGAEWHRQKRDRDERFRNRWLRVSAVYNQGRGSRDEIYEEPQAGEATPWTFYVTNDSDTPFHGIQILYEYRHPDPAPADRDILKLRKKAIGSEKVADGHRLGLLAVPLIQPGETEAVPTVATKAIRLAFLRVPQQGRIGGRRVWVATKSDD